MSVRPDPDNHGHADDCPLHPDHRKPVCTCDLDLLAHDDRATHAYGCPAFVVRLEA